MSKQQSPLEISDTDLDEIVIHVQCECGNSIKIEGTKDHFRCECGRYIAITVTDLSKSDTVSEHP